MRLSPILFSVNATALAGLNKRLIVGSIVASATATSTALVPVTRRQGNAR